jgi:hypothetical protein
MIRGNLWEAIRFNPLLILGGPVILVAIGVQRRRERAGAPAAPRLIWGLFAVLVIYSIARNLPSPTRSWLAPPSAATTNLESEIALRQMAE